MNGSKNKTKNIDRFQISSLLFTMMERKEGVLMKFAKHRLNKLINLIKLTQPNKYFFKKFKTDGNVLEKEKWEMRQNLYGHLLNLTLTATIL